jgi:hypothetical protein
MTPPSRGTIRPMLGIYRRSGEQSLTLDAIEYAPVRNVVGHTGLLTGKGLLRLKYENIKARIKKLVAEKPPATKKGVAKKRARRK